LKKVPLSADTTAAAAIIDRLIHHAEIIALTGSSFRTHGKERAIPSTVPPAHESP
jgi:DNA replication protein DnaC